MTSSTGIEFLSVNGTPQAAGLADPPAAAPAAGPVVDSPLPPAPVVPLAAPTAAPAPPPAAKGPRLQRREVEVDIPEYPGFRLKLWLNYPQKWETELNGSDYPPAPTGDAVTPEAYKAWSDGKAAFIFGAWGRVILAHNGWRDFDGNPLPQPQDLAFWETIPNELAATIVAVQKDAKAELPNSIPQRRRR